MNNDIWLLYIHTFQLNSNLNYEEKVLNNRISRARCIDENIFRIFASTFVCFIKKINKSHRCYKCGVIYSVVVHHIYTLYT